MTRTRSLLSGAIACAALLALASPARAFVTVVEDETASSETARVTAEVRDPITLARSEVRVTIKDQVAVVTLSHVFRSHVDRVLQARYVFPLGPGAHVTGYAIWEDGVRLEGDLMEVSKAESLYRRVTSQEITRVREMGQEVRAVRVARDPGLLRETAAGEFETHIYPILPRQEKPMELTYAETLAARDGWCAWRFPLDAAARAQRSPLEAVSFDVTIADTAGVAEVACDFPGAVVERGPAGAHVTFEGREVRPDRAFVVRFRSALAPLRPAVLAHRAAPEGDGFALVRVALPSAGETSGAGPLAIVLAADASGSMAGAKRARADESMRRVEAALGPRDRVVETVRFERMEEGLLRALDLAAEAAAGVPGARPLVVLSSDGVTDEDPDLVLAAIDRARPEARILVLATGHDDDMALLVRIAERRGGIAWVPGAGETDALFDRHAPDILSKGYGVALLEGGAPADLDAAPLLERFREGAVVDARLDGLPPGCEALPVVRGAIPEGAIACFLLRYPRGGVVEARLRASAGARRLDVALTLPLPEREEAHRFLAGFFAKARVRDMLRESPHGLRDPNRDAIIALSLAHRFVTPYTAFISLPEAERRRMGLRPSVDGPDPELYRFATATPEAETWALVAVGLLAAGLYLRRRGAARPAHA